jgi:hypothetical protein
MIIPKKISRFMRLVRKYLTPFLERRMTMKTLMMLMMKMNKIILIFLKRKLSSKSIRKKQWSK